MAETATFEQPAKVAAATHPSFLRKWGSLIVLSLALAIIIIDTTLLNVSLANIIRDFNTTIQSIQWVITAYALTLAALTITGGRIGDIFGRKKMFMTGAIIFAAGSFLASISHSVPVLLAGESIIEGVGAALMMPATASLLVSNFFGRDRAIAFGIWGGVAGAASAVGPILGGYLTSTYSWRWGFRINVFVAAALILGSVLIKEARETEERPSIDWFGIVLSSLGLLSLVFGIIESSTYGWWRAKEVFIAYGHTYGVLGLSITPIAIVVGLLFLYAFINWEYYVEEKEDTPLVSMKLFKNQQFISGATTLMMVSLSLVGLIFILPIFFQAVKGLDAFHTGLALLPLSISLFFAAPFSALLTKWFTPKRIIQVGLLLNALALLIMRQSISVSATAADLAFGFALFGIGMGFVQSQISNLTLSAVSVQQAGEASGVTNTFRQIGGSLGTAIVGAVLLATLTTNLTNGVSNSRVIPQAARAPIGSAVSTQTSNVEFGGGAHLDGNTPATIRTEVKTIANQATTDSVRYALWFALLFAALAFVVSFRLPNIKNVETGQSTAAGRS